MADRNQQNQVPQNYEGQHVDARQRQRPVLTADELRVLRECNRESFWYRCVPLGIVFIGSTQLLVNKGYLSANPRFGALFKNMGAALAAFLLGKMSYQGRCREKILSLENSALAESMRTGKRGVEFMRDLTMLPGSEGRAPDEWESQSHAVKSDFGSEGHTVESKGLDDSRRPSMDRETSLYQRSDTQPTDQPGLSYEELRNRNRVEYEQKANLSKSGGSRDLPPSYQRAPPPPSSSEPSSGSSWTTESSSGPKGGRKNKYGDAVE